jgi:Flp pilus assembly protein TadD
MALLAGTFLLYAGVSGHAFLWFDDNRYVTENPMVRAGLTWRGVEWAFTTLAVSNWHPLTWLSHMLDVELFGLDPGVHHLVNVALHAVNAALVFVALGRLTGAPWRSAMVAALFAVHPTHVESVAWVAERKDVLSTLLGLLALLAYAGWARRGGAARYLAVVACFAASLLAKPMWVTFPFLLLVLDAWPLQRWEGSPIPLDPGPPPTPRRGMGALLLEKVPLLALSIASSAVTVLAQSRGGAVKGLDLGVAERLGNAAVAYVRYVGKTAWPSPLAIYYPLLPGGIPAWQAILAGLLVVGATVSAVAAARRLPWLTVGWLWFLGTLVPVIGLVQVGAQAMADRYTYLPGIGVYVIVAWGGAALAERWRLRTGAVAIAAAALVALSAVTWHQIGYWSDHVTLFRHAVEVEPPTAVPLGILSEGLRRAGNLPEALARAGQAVELSPGNPRHWTNLALIQRDLGQLPEARQSLQRAIELDPGYGLAWLNLGFVEADAGRPAEAIAAHEGALARGVENGAALGNLAVLYLAVGRPDRAGWAFQRSAELDPGNPAVWWNLGIFRMREGRLDEAEQAFLRVRRLDPGNAQVGRQLEEIRRRRGS